MANFEGATLLMVLSDNKYALALSPGFFRFYALTGVLHAFEEKKCLHATHVSGSSAGAMVGGFYASGMAPSEMIKSLFSIQRTDVWDIGGIGGLLQGQLFHKILTRVLPIQDIKDCKIPYGATAYDLLGFRTNILQDGCLATAIRASCTFPGLFQPVIIDRSPHIDGGVFDDSGLMALPGVPSSNLIVNIVCGEMRRGSSYLPSQFEGAQLLTIIMRNVPMVSPFTMSTMGPVAFSIARDATIKALEEGTVTRRGENMWECVIDGAGIVPTETLDKLTAAVKSANKEEHDRQDCSKKAEQPDDTVLLSPDKKKRDSEAVGMISDVMIDDTGLNELRKTVEELEEVNDLLPYFPHRVKRKRRRKYYR